MKQLFFIAAGIVMFTSCSPKTTATTTVEPAEKSLSADAQKGQALYNENCGKCHKLPLISSHSEEKWQKIVPPMAKKAKLDATQESLVMAYVNESLK